MKTTTIISVLYKDYGSFDYMIKTALATSDNIEQILICDNGNNESIIKQYSLDNRIRFIKGHNTGSGSVSHGLGINKLLPLVRTPIVALIEPDVMLLNSGWDELPDGIDLRAGFKSKYRDYACYLPCFVVGRAEKLKNIDFTPGNPDITVPTSDIKTFFDVGWRVSRANLPAEVLDFKRCINGQCSIVPNDLFSKKTNEFWLGDKPIAAHLWRGSDPEKRGPKYKEDFELWRQTAEAILQRVSK